MDPNVGPSMDTNVGLRMDPNVGPRMKTNVGTRMDPYVDKLIALALEAVWSRMQLIVAVVL